MHYFKVPKLRSKSNTEATQNLGKCQPANLTISYDTFHVRRDEMRQSWSILASSAHGGRNENDPVASDKQHRDVPLG